jgi:DNA repair exonuclease SbcCD ATPase subunit
MTQNFKSVFEVHTEINNAKKFYEYKKQEYTNLLELNNQYHVEEMNLQNKMNDYSTHIRSIESLLNYENPNDTEAMSIRNSYIIEYNKLEEELNDMKDNIRSLENEIHKYTGFEIYIDNLYKMIPRINRWGNVENMSEYEKDMESFANNYMFNTQLSIINFPPPKLERN